MRLRGTRKRVQLQVRRLGDEEHASQYGSLTNPIGGKPFKCHPGPKDADGLSMSAGRVPAAEAHALVFAPMALDGDGVRITTVGKLRRAGFKVLHTPSQGNPEHVSVSRAHGTWATEDDATFDACFTEDPEWFELDKEEV